MNKLNPLCQRSMKLAWQRYKRKEKQQPYYFPQAKVRREIFSLYLQESWDLIQLERKNPLIFLPLA